MRRLEFLNDEDGIDIDVLKQLDSSSHRNIIRAGTIIEMFRMTCSNGGTPTSQRLNKILKWYL
jgi:hypothetical protein